MLDTELAAEQAHLDRAYARLDALQAQARQLASSEWRDHSHTPAAMLERDVREAHGIRRLGSLRIDGGLCFGRIDTEAGQTFHVGRVGVAEDDLTPLVVDWRAPVAEPFYRATPLEPMGLVRRRHLLTRGRRVVGIEDEPLHVDAAEVKKRGLVLVGEAALLGALTERRTGRMRDIVATIQAEQDQIIRSPLSEVLVVQGGPGTGKTAVALHRAAFLLYRHRFPLEEQGVLVLGPNPVFLRYIERVLPSLGESRVRLATVDDLHRTQASGHETDREVARIKGDARMATVVANAIASRQRPLLRREVVGVGSYRLRIGRGSTTSIIEAAQARPGTHNQQRPFVERVVIRHLERQYALAVERARTAGLAAPSLERDEVRERLAASRDVRVIIDRIWPVLTAEQLLGDLYAHEPLLRDAAGALFDEAEWKALLRPVTEPFTTSDLPLLDEADVLLGPTRAPVVRKPHVAEDASAMVDRILAGMLPFCRECDQELTFEWTTQKWVCGTFGCGKTYESEEVMDPATAVQVRDLQRVLGAHIVSPHPDEPDGWFAKYGHIVVDEAQELSPMQWRMLARRCPNRSMTIVGDLAQGSGPSAIEAWDDVFTALGTNRGRVVELTVNYRTPAEVMALADRVSGTPGLARCVREVGFGPSAVEVAPDADIISVACDVAAAELAAVEGGKVGVIAPPSAVRMLRDTITVVTDGADDTTSLEADITVLDPEAAKGLEFDSVVVVEPSAFDARSLYVALTRTTTRLALVHQRELPEALATSGITR